MAVRDIGVARAHSLSRELAGILTGIAIVFYFAGTALSADDIRVEGIVHDSADPGQSVAILNGALVKQGDHIGPYKIVSIAPDAVLGIDESSGKEMRWEPAVKPPEPPAFKKKPLSAVKSLDAPEPSRPEENRPGSGNSFSWNPFDALSSSAEMQAISDIHQIHRAALIYHESRNGADAGAPDLKKLGDAGLLSRELAGGVKGKYRYTLAFSRSGFEVNADPSDSALRHFYIGQDGVLRSEPKIKATAKSPVHEY